jgi:hypothetical protein
MVDFTTLETGFVSPLKKGFAGVEIVLDAVFPVMPEAKADAGFAFKTEGEVDEKFEIGVNGWFETVAKSEIETGAGFALKAAEAIAPGAVVGVKLPAESAALSAMGFALTPAICICGGLTVNSALSSSAPSLRTETVNTPGLAIRLGGITAVNSSALVYTVCSGVPPHSTNESGVNFSPCTVSVKSAPPAIATVGLKLTVWRFSAIASRTHEQASVNQRTTENHRLSERELNI